MDEEEKFQKQMQEYNDDSLAFSLGKGSDPATDQRFNEYRKESKSRSDQAADQFKGVSEDSLISKAGARDTFIDESTGVAGNMKFNELTEPILNKTSVDMTSTNVADNTASITNTGNSNTNSLNLTSGGILSAPPSISLEQMNSMFAGEKADALGKADDSFKTKKSNAPTLMKQNNEISSSRKRGGLFGNYGKQVEIKKTFNKSTGRTNKQKFVDGELFSDRNSRQDVRRAGRNAASNKRTNRKAGRNK